MKKYRPYTMTTWDRMVFLKQATERIAKQGLEGAFIECGVWRGGNLLIMRDVLASRHIPAQRIYGFDTFAGMTKPDDRDRKICNNEPALPTWGSQQRGEHNEWCFAPIEDVQKVVPDVTLIKGDVLETIPASLPEKIALLRVDVDWYEPTKHILTHALPRMVKGGCIIFDDYGSWAGARKAIDECLPGAKLTLIDQASAYLFV
jgi:O-methyltransferase